MKLEDIKKEMPKTPEMIHNRIQDEIKKQMENEQIVFQAYQQVLMPVQNGMQCIWKNRELIRWQQRFRPMNRAK